MTYPTSCVSLGQANHGWCRHNKTPLLTSVSPATQYLCSGPIATASLPPMLNVQTIAASLTGNQRVAHRLHEDHIIPYIGAMQNAGVCTPEMAHRYDTLTAQLGEIAKEEWQKSPFRCEDGSIGFMGKMGHVVVFTTACEVYRGRLGNGMLVSASPRLVERAYVFGTPNWTSPDARKVFP